MSSARDKPQLRRVITGHDADGQAVFAADELIDGRELAEDSARSGATFFHLWATHEMPVDASDETLERQRAGSEATTIANGAGSVLRIGVLAPGARSPMHRTTSLDYGICLEGECELELDSGERTTVRAGDVVIQRATNHRWHNRSAAPCRIAWILIDALPPVVGGRQLETSWVHD